MSSLMHAESRRSYSWWWDSHISPKNSKWLQENLTDMDMKVKAMIKLVEEDADSFARRAEMFYKKRPELLKLVEEFYRAYRALAERYDHATGALRHAHRTMAEAFPNHIPLALPDESSSSSSVAEAFTHTPDMSSPIRGLMDNGNLHKDASEESIIFGDGSEENEALATKQDLKQFNEIFAPREGIARVKVLEGKARKVLNFEDEEVRARVKVPGEKVRKNLTEEEKIELHAKSFVDPKSSADQGMRENQKARIGIKHLQEEVSQLSIENQKLKLQIMSESKHLSISRSEVENLRDAISKLESEKEAAILENHLSKESIYSLEVELSKVKEEIKRINDEMEMANVKLSSAEKQCLELEKANQCLQLELEEAKLELAELKISLQESEKKRVEAEMSLHSSEHLYNQSEEQVMILALEIQSQVEKLKEIERNKVVLEEQVSELKDMNASLNEQNLVCALKIKELQDEILSLKEIKGKLEEEIENHSESKKILQQEIDSLKDGRYELDLKHQSLTEQMEAARLHAASLETLVKELRNGHAEMNEGYKMLEDKNVLLLTKLKDMESVSDRNAVLEISLSDANVEQEEFREKIKVLENSCMIQSATVTTHISEKAALASQLAVISEIKEKLSEKNTVLENSLDDANTELEGLRSKLKELEESCESANLGLLSLKNDLTYQVERVQLNLANMEATLALLEDRHLNLVKEKDESIEKVLKLEDSLSAIEREHEFLIQSNIVQLVNLEDQILLLQEDGQIREGEFEAANQNFLSHSICNFILQRCICDVKDSLFVEKQKYKSYLESTELQLTALENQIYLIEEERKADKKKYEEEEEKSFSKMLEIFILQVFLSKMKKENFALFQECRKHQEASSCAEERIKHLEGRELAQKEKITLLSDHISKLRDGILLLVKALNINKEKVRIDGNEVLMLQTILGEVMDVLGYVSLSSHENQLLHMEISVYLSLLKQFGLQEVLSSQELGREKQQCLILQQEKHHLFESCEQLHREITARDLTNQALIAKLESLDRKLEDLSKEEVLLSQELGKEKQQCLILQQEKHHLFESCEQLHHEITGRDLTNQALLGSVSLSSHENQLLHMEISVYLSLLKQFGLQEALSSQELGREKQQCLILQQEKHHLLESCEQLHREITGRDLTNQALIAKLESLDRKLEDLSKELPNLKEEKVSLEEENSSILSKAMKLEHLYLYFRGLNAESMQQLKLLGSDISSLLALKNACDDEIRESKTIVRAVENENKKLKDSLVLFEELRSVSAISAFDLYTFKDIHEELVVQVENGENLLKEKSIQLSKASNMLECKEKELSEVYVMLEASNKELDETKRKRLELENKLSALLETTTCKDEAIAIAYEEKRMLSAELGRFNAEVGDLRLREQWLYSELEKEKEEVGRCEGDMVEILNEVHVSQVNAAVLGEKVFELEVSCEALEISTMVQRETLKEEIAIKDAHANGLKREISDLENENGRLKTKLNELLLLFSSLGNGISLVEEHVCQLTSHNANQDNPSVFLQEKTHLTSTADNTATEEVLKVQNLVAKVEAVKELVISTNKCIDEERLQSAANLESAIREIEDLKLKLSYDREEKQGSETSSGKHGVVIKDIELDQISNSCSISRLQSTEADDQMVKLWESTEREFGNQLSSGHDIEAVQEVKRNKPSAELDSQKELGVDRLEMSTEIKEQVEEWSRRVVERLAYNAKKLSSLQASAQELKVKMDKSGKNMHHNSVGHANLMDMLREAEEAVSELVESNGELTRSAESRSISSSVEEIRNVERRKVMERAGRESDKIGMLELELEKIHYIFLKLEEERESDTVGGGNRTPRVLLRDYLYGRKFRQGKKRIHFCSCMRPTTRDA